jgi:L-malate glycosyltransferase
MQRAIRKPVLIATRGLDDVGTGRQVELLAVGLAAAGHDVHVAFTSVGGCLADRLAAAGIPVHRLGRRPVSDAAAGQRWVRLARALRPAVAVSFGRRQAVLAAVARVAVPGTRGIAHVAAPVRGALVPWLLRRLDRVVTPSTDVAHACGRRGLDPGRIVAIPPGIVAAEGRGLSRVEIAARLGLDPAAEWTLCVAPLAAESRLERLLWGIDQLGVVRKGMQHVLVGAGPLASRVRRRSRVQELAERLFLVPNCDVLPDLLGHVAYVWQAGSVALGGVILDAMAKGVPAVAVESAAARQLIDDRLTGWLVPPLPESEFPRRAFNLLEDPGMAARYGAAARVRAAAEFPATRMIEAWAALIDGLDGAP